MALDIMGREIVDASASADFQASLERYSLTDRAPVNVANLTEAKQIATQLETAGLTQAFPLFVYLQDSQRHMCKPGLGETWVILGGRLHGAQAQLDGTCEPATITELPVSEEGFLKQSVGFTRAPNGGVLIPEYGLYRIHFGGNLDAFLHEDGRRYVRLRRNGSYIGGRTEFEGDTQFHFAIEWEFFKGDVITAVGYQDVKDTSGAKRPRVISATLGIYQSLSPSW